MPPRLPRKGPHVTFRVEVLDASASRVGHVVVLSVPATSLLVAVKLYVANRHSMLTKATSEAGTLYLGTDRLSDTKTLADCNVKPGAQLTLKLPEGARVAEGAVEPTSGAGAGAGAGTGPGAGGAGVGEGAVRVGTEGIWVRWVGLVDDGRMQFHPPWTRATTFADMFDQAQVVVDEFAERAAGEYVLTDIAVDGHEDEEWDVATPEDPDGDHQSIDTIARLCGLSHDITFVLTVDSYDPDNPDDMSDDSDNTSQSDDDDDDDEEEDETEDSEDDYVEVDDFVGHHALAGMDPDELEVFSDSGEDSSLSF